MSFLAKLELEGETYNLLNCSYSLEQAIDYNHKPSGTTRGGQISMTIESNGTTVFLKWMVGRTLTKAGKITFHRRDVMGKLYEIKFSQAYCVDYVERFEATFSSPMQVDIVISAKKLEVGEDSVFENQWMIPS